LHILKSTYVEIEKSFRRSLIFEYIFLYNEYGGNMKTSLILDDRVFNDAKKEAHKTGMAISEIISSWAALGRDVWRQKKSQTPKKFKPLNLGPEKVDLTDRKEWMEALEDDGT
jgi:hypothetical protein